MGNGTRFLSLSGYLSPELWLQIREARGPGPTRLAQAELFEALGAAQTCGRVSGPHPGNAVPSGAQRRARVCVSCGGPSSLCPHLGLVQPGSQVLSPSSRSVAGAAEGLHRVSSPRRRALKTGAGSGASAQTSWPGLEEGPGCPFAGTHAPAAEMLQACRGPHGRAPSSRGRARAGSGTMTRAPLAAAPSQPAAKPISHSGRQSPAAQRFVPRGPGPLSLALITLSRLTAPPAAPRTPVPRRPPHNGSGNRPRWGPD